MGSISSNIPISTITLSAIILKSCCTIFYENTTNGQNIILVKFLNSLSKKADPFLAPPWRRPHALHSATEALIMEREH